MSTKPTFHDYMRRYGEDHQHPVNRATHLVGVPMIVASLPFLPILGLPMFATGWALQFVGHAFEGKKPSFASDLRYLAIGPVWAMVEWVEVVTGTRMYEPPAAATTSAVTERAPAATNGVAHASTALAS